MPTTPASHDATADSSGSSGSNATLLPIVAISAITAAGASILTTLAARRVGRRLRLRAKLRAFRHAVSAARAGSTQLRRMVDGRSYDCDEALLLHCRNAAHALVGEHNRPDATAAERGAVLEALLGSGKLDGCVEPPFHVDYGINLHVGKNFYVNFGCTILDCARVTIGDNVFLGPGVQIYAATHPLDAVERRSTEFAKPVSIGDDVWIGGGAIVLPGVSVGSRVVIAAGAVVTKDVDDDVMVAGVPARVVKKLR